MRRTMMIWLTVLSACSDVPKATGAKTDDRGAMNANDADGTCAPTNTISAEAPVRCEVWSTPGSVCGLAVGARGPCLIGQCDLEGFCRAAFVPAKTLCLVPQCAGASSVKGQCDGSGSCTAIAQ